MNRKVLAISLVLVFLATATLWMLKLRAVAPANAAVAEKIEGEISVLVKTQKVSQQTLDRTLLVFGEVSTGKVDTINVAQAGQVVQISVVAGQQVRLGEVVAVLSTDPNAQAAYLQAVSAQKFALGELSRLEELLTLQLTTQSQLDAGKKLLVDAESNLAAQKKLGGDQSVSKILAPFNGVVTAISANQGDRIAAGGAILQLGRTDDLRFQFGVEPTQIGLIRVGMDIEIAAIHDAEKSVKAKVKAMQSMIDPKTQQANVIVELPAKSIDPQFIPGAHVQAKIRVGNNLVWEVPRQAVLTDDKGDYLFQVNQGKANRIGVTKANEGIATYGVEGKLDANLPLIVLGNYEVQDGMSVREGQR